MEPNTTLGIGLAILGSQELQGRLFGPSADYVGQRMRGLIEKCDINVGKVFERAWQMLGPRLQVDGVVGPRVLKSIIDEAMYCDDEMTANYLGGVLASSRTESGRDDRGVSYLKLIESLSSYQLRIHFLLYSALALSESRGLREREGIWEGSPPACTMGFTESSLIEAMEYGAGESHESIAQHTFIGLNNHGLCEEGVELMPHWPDDLGDKPFRFIFPTPHGFMLYLWGNGMGQLDPQSYFALEPESIPRMQRELHVLTVAAGCVGFLHPKGGQVPEPPGVRYRGNWGPTP